MPRFELLAVDLDGTLLDSTRRIPDENRRALCRAYRAGTRIAVVTGRRLPAALPSLGVLDDIDPLLVFNSGAFVKEGFRGPMLRRRLLSRCLAMKVLAVGRQMGVGPIVHDGPNGEGYILIESAPSGHPAMARYLEKTSPPPRLVSDLTAALSRDPVQIGFASTVEVVRRLSRSIESRFPHETKLARTEYADLDFALLDVLAPEATKAEAVRFLAKRYLVPLEKTMAIGDNWNDLEMLEAAGFAVLMSNAPPELLSRGFATTGSNDEAGVAQAIRKHILGEG